MFMRLDTEESGKFKAASPVSWEPLISDCRVDLREPEARSRPLSRKLHCRRPLHNALLVHQE